MQSHQKSNRFNCMQESANTNTSQNDHKHLQRTLQIFWGTC
jgi:hypothetical protein